MLRTVDLVSGANVPIIGVNVSQLGYLTDIEPAATREALEGFLRGEHRLEQRMLLAVRIDRAGHEPEEHLAFNEAVLEKTPTGHTVRLAVERSEEHTSELQSLMSNSYAVFRLKKKKTK